MAPGVRVNRKILISPGYGAGWSTWNSQAPQLAEDAELVRLVEAGEHAGPILYKSEDDVVQRGDRGASDAFYDRACAVMRDADCEDASPYCGGVGGLIVVEGEGPYRVNEYDGSESIEWLNTIGGFR